MTTPNVQPPNAQPPNEQVPTFFITPLQAFIKLSVETSEKLINAQLDAQKAHVELGLEQVRKLARVKDTAELRGYMEDQQRVAKTFAERIKGSADQVVGIQREFVHQGQKLTEENVQKVQQAVSQLHETG